MTYTCTIKKTAHPRTIYITIIIKNIAFVFCKRTIKEPGRFSVNNQISFIIYANMIFWLWRRHIAVICIKNFSWFNSHQNCMPLHNSVTYLRISSSSIISSYFMGAESFILLAQASFQALCL